MARRRRVLGPHPKALLAVCALGLALLAVWLVGRNGPAEPGRGLAALGDSFTTGFASGGACAPTENCPANSWATGTNPEVKSHHRRRGARNQTGAGRAFNLAVSGQKVADLDAQAEAAVSRGVDAVTILVGLNDLCRETEGAMTPVATFREQFATALDRLHAGLPDARVLVGSVPDPYRLWQRHADDPAATRRWSALGVCQAMLQDPVGTSAATVGRRARVRRRGLDFNAQLREVCATRTGCRYDGGAVSRRWNWTVATSDFFHPSVAGQRELSSVLWAARSDE